MGLVVHKENERHTRLNDKISADLRERAQRTSGISDPDLVEGSDYTSHTIKTGRFAWVWIVLVVLAIASLVSMALL